MENKREIYLMYGIDTAMQLLRPGAKWEITNKYFTRWDDPRPQPSWDEIVTTLDKIKQFEETIPTVFTDEQIEKYNNFAQKSEK